MLQLQNTAERHIRNECWTLNERSGTTSEESMKTHDREKPEDRVQQKIKWRQKEEKKPISQGR